MGSAAPGSARADRPDAPAPGKNFGGERGSQRIPGKARASLAAPTWKGQATGSEDPGGSGSGCGSCSLIQNNSSGVPAGMATPYGFSQ